MSVLNPAWLIGPWLLALGTVALLNRLSPSETTQPGRHASIDGLRGHLALAVFIHHGIIWHSYLRTGLWDAPASNLFNQLGQGSVALFFMITAFLFVGKLLDAKGKPIDWGRLYMSRVLRLAPLYLLAMLALTVAFSLIASGNSLFGALTSSASRRLGDLAYGLYLLHGLLLYATLNHVIGTTQASAFTASEHWAWLVALTPLLVVLAWLCFRRVEQPCMQLTDEWTRALTARLAKLHPRVS